MPLGDFEREVMRMLAGSRNPDSFVGGGTVLHQAQDSPRSSEDVGLFHDTIEALESAFNSDVETLRGAGFSVEQVGRSRAKRRRRAVGVALIPPPRNNFGAGCLERWYA
jgi:hypothetical protein